MSQTDVRVRLSVEGMAQVQAAMRQVAAESRRTADSSAKSFGRFGAALGGVKNMLGSIGIAVGVGVLIQRFSSLANSAMTAAESMVHFAQIMGTTVENAQALTLAVARTDTDLAKLQRGMIKFNTALQDFKAGGGAAASSFRALGVSVKDVAGKDTAEAFGVVAEHVSKLKDSGEKLNAFAKLTGVRLASLLPLVNELGQSGFAGLREEAVGLGLIFDKQLLYGAKNLGDEFRVLDLQMKALATRFIGGLAPSAITALQGIEGELGTNATKWEEWGRSVGKWGGIAALSIAEGFDVLFVVLAGVKTELVAISEILFNLLSLDWGRIPGANKRATAEIKQIAADWMERTKARSATLKEIQSGKVTNFGAPGDKGDDAGSIFDEITLQTEKADAIHKRQTAEFAAREQINKGLLARSLISLKAYYDERTDIIAGQFLADKEWLAKRREIAGTEDDAKKRAAELSKITTEEELLEIKRLSDIKDAILDAGAARENLQKELEEGLAREEEIRGDTFSDAMRNIATEETAYRNMLRARGDMDKKTQDRLVQQHVDMLTTKAYYDEQALSNKRALESMNLDVDAVGQRIAAGLLSQVEGEQRILQIKRQHLSVLQSLAETQYQLALDSTNPDRINDARAFKLAIEEVALALEREVNVVQRLRATFADAATAALTTFFSTGISQAKKFSDAIHEMAMSVIASLRALLSQMLATQIMTGIMSLFPAAHQGGRMAIPFPSRALGGFLPGAGPTPIIAHGGEFVVRAREVSRPGMLSHLVMLNRGLAAPALRRFAAAPRFAEGGLVGAPGAALSSSGSSSIEGNFTLGLEDGLIERRVARFFDSPAGSRIMVRAYAKNRNAISRVAGR